MQALPCISVDGDLLKNLNMHTELECKQQTMSKYLTSQIIFILVTLQTAVVLARVPKVLDVTKSAVPVCAQQAAMVKTVHCHVRVDSLERTAYTNVPV